MKIADHVILFLKLVMIFLIVFSLFFNPATASTDKGSSIKQLPDGVSQDWLSKVQKDIGKTEYNIRCEEKTDISGISNVWQALNRSQNLQAYFMPEGICIMPIDSAKQSWTWGLSLIRYGTNNSTNNISALKPAIAENRITYRRGSITEWYVNNEQGIEQGFTILYPPNGTSSQIILGMKIQSDLQGRLKDSNTLEFKTKDGECVIRMAKLKVYDANRKKLAATYNYKNNTLEILIDAAYAAYPITVDPMISSPSWTAESDQSYSSFGNSVATAGDVNGDGYDDIIVAASFPSIEGVDSYGWVSVYYGSSSGLSNTAAWSVQSDQAGVHFGESVACAGDVNGDGYSDIIIGAQYYSNGQDLEGRVYVYYGSSSGLGTTASWIAESNQRNSSFGHSVATAGDVNGDGYSDIIVGANWYDNDQANEGRVYVYYGSSSGLSSTPSWTAESNQENCNFGSSVATAGDVNGDGYSDVIIGAPDYIIDETNKGKVYVYYGSSSGLDSLVSWTAESGKTDSEFGQSVAAAGDVNGDGYSDIIIGDPIYSDGDGKAVNGRDKLSQKWSFKSEPL